MAQSVQIEDVNHRHEAIADMMLSCPDMKKGAIAEKLGYTGAWLSAVINSDAFIAYYERRRLQYNQELHNQTVRNLYELAIKSTELQMERLEETDEDDLPDDRFILDVGDKALHRLGYGPSASKTPQGGGNQTNIYLVDPETLKRAQDRLNTVPGLPDVLNPLEVSDETLSTNREGDAGAVFEGAAEVLPTEKEMSGSEEKGDIV